MTEPSRQKPRSCVACRAESPKAALIRVVRTPSGNAEFDPSGKLPGRGAYICPNAECLVKAKKSGVLGHALKTTISDECWAALEARVKALGEDHSLGAEERLREIRSLLGLSRRAGLLTIGRDAIEAHISAKRAPLLVMTASDASDAVKGFADNLVGMSKDRKHGHVHAKLPLSAEELSGAIGGSGRIQVAAVPARSGMADRFNNLVNNF